MSRTASVLLLLTAMLLLSLGTQFVLFPRAEEDFQE
jgi:hypothetical protein